MMSNPWRALWGFRLFVMVGLAGAVLTWFYMTDPMDGADTRVRIYGRF